MMRIRFHRPRQVEKLKLHYHQRELGHRRGFESLESRNMLAVVAWDGGGDGVSWIDPLNWSSDQLPGADADVEINVAQNPHIVLTSGTHSIRSLNSSEALTLAGGDLQVSATVQVDNTFTLSGGTIIGGTIVSQLLMTGGGGTLDGVTVPGNLLSFESGGASATLTNTAVSGELLLSGDGASVQIGGTTSFAAARLSGRNSDLRIEAGYTLNSLVSAEGTATGFRRVILAYGASGTVTFGPSAEVRLAAGSGGDMSVGQSGGPATLINHGLIAAEAADRNLFLGLNSFTNHGTLRATGGSSLDVGGNSWANGGLIEVTGATLRLRGDWNNVAGQIHVTDATTFLGGTFTTAGLNLPSFTRIGGAMHLVGTLDNTGATLMLDTATGPWNLSGGTVTGGTIVSQLSMTSGGGTLDGVTVSGDLLLFNSGGASATLTNTTVSGELLLSGDNAAVQIGGTTSFAAARLSGRNSDLRIEAGYTLNSLVSAEGTATGFRRVILAYGASGTVTFGPSAEVRLAAGSGGDMSVGQSGGPATLINHGLIAAEAADRNLFLGLNSFTNQGTLRATGGSSLDLSGSLAVLHPAGIQVDSNSTMIVRGSLTSDTRSGSQFQAKGRITAVGGTEVEPLLFEVMSRDEGSIPSSYVNNFAVGTLSLHPVSYVRLVDASNNTSGPSTEVLYVNALIVPDGATLDLNGRTVYARTVQASGQIVNGSVHQLPDSGPLAIGVATPGSISAAGELDEWTFFGRTGRNLTIQLNPGVSASFAVPGAIPPQLNFAQLTLLDPGGNVVATSNSTIVGELLTLNAVDLPSDGVYRLQVRAAPEQSTATGNYYVAAYDVTVDMTPLLINQQTSGTLQVPFSTDRWTFALSEGQQIRFDLINANTSALRFTLDGPDGYQPFASFVGDSELITIPAGYGGQYVLSVSAPQGHVGSYSFAIEETSLIDLPLATPTTGTLVGPGSALLYKVSAPGSTALIVSLEHSRNTDRTELYVSRGVRPTRGDYDYRFEVPDSADHSIVVPNATAGDWYILVYGSAVPSPADYVMRAVANDFLVTEMSRDTYSANTVVSVSFDGVGFLPGMQVELVASDSTIYSAMSIEVESYSQLTAIMDLTSVPEGVYDVKITLPGGATETLLDSFTVIPPSGTGKLETRIISDAALGRHALATIYVEYANTGNAAMPAPIIQLSSADPDDSDRPILTLDKNHLELGNSTTVLPAGFGHSVSFLGSGVQPGLLLPGEVMRVPVYYAGLLYEWDFADTSVEFGLSIIESDDSHAMNWAGTTYVQLDHYQEIAVGGVVGTFLIGHEIRELEWTDGAPPTDSQLRPRLGLPPYSPNAVSSTVIARRFDEPGILQLRPDSISADAWNAIISNLQHSITTFGDWVRVLGENAQFLARSGLSVTDIGKLWGYELAQAGAGLGPVQIIDAMTDLALPAPGMALSLSRTFVNGLPSRYTTGAFGQGWQMGWDATLVEESGPTPTERGAVTIGTSTGLRQRYAPDIRDPLDSKYFSELGDNSELTKLVGVGFELRAVDGTVTRFGSDGRLSYVQDRNGNRISLGFDFVGRPDSLTHSNGASIHLNYNDAGRVISAEDSAGRKTTYGYDPTNTYLLSVTTDDGKVTSYTYNVDGVPQTRHALTSITRAGVTQTIDYDPFGRIDDIYLADHVQLLDFSYDTAGLVALDDGTGITKLSYDDRGLLVRVTDPLGYSTIQDFDREYRLTSIVAATGETQSLSWLDFGGLRSFTDELGHKTSFAYDNPFRQLTGFTDARGNTTRYTYDANGNLLSTIYPNDTVAVLANYTSEGLPQSSTNRRGQSQGFEYNVAGLPTKQTFADGSHIDYEFDARGNLRRIVDGAEITVYEYDFAQSGDRLTRVTYPNGRFLAYDYDEFGRRISTTDQSGYLTLYDYDSVSRLWRLRDGEGATLVTYIYEPSGRLSRVDKGNGSYTTYSYDSAGQLLHLVNHHNDTAVNSRFDYTYDRRGRRLSMSTLDGVWTYAYDSTSRLIQAVFVSNNITVIPNQNLRYEYDAVGNRIRSVVNGAITDYVVNNLNQYASVDGILYTYDADGNLTFDGDNSYEYDEHNMLVRIIGSNGVTEYEYDALGHRVGTIHDGLLTAYQLDPLGTSSVVATFGGTDASTTRYAYGLGLVNRVDSIDGIGYYEFDANGNTAGLTDSAGNIVNQYAYLPFGGRLRASESYDNPFEFVGQFGVQSEPAGIHFMQARFAKPDLGRFMSVDPASLLSGSFNFLTYADNNPVTFIDPLGFASNQYLGRNPFSGQWSFDIGKYFEDAWNNVILSSVDFAPIGTPPPGANGCTLSPDRIGPWVLSAACNKHDLAYRNGASFRDKLDADWQLFEDLKRAGLPRPISFVYYSFVLVVGTYFYYLPSDAIHTVGAVDPNDKSAPAGFGSNNHVRSDAALTYRIRFENVGPGSENPATSGPFDEGKWATAPAQRVTITDQLASDLDWPTFRLSELGFGDTIVSIPPNTQHFETTVAITYDGKTFDVHLLAGIDLLTGRVFAHFQSLDPETGLPPNVLTGFLLPEDGTGRGKGYLAYSVKPKPNLVTGTEIRNVALISFDGQMLIATNQADPFDPTSAVTDPTEPTYGRLNARNTIDAEAPSSAVASLPAVTSTKRFAVSWGGSDGVGSGIQTYDVYVSIDGGEYTPWATGTPDASGIYEGTTGHSYRFFSVATDGVGYRESLPTQSDAETTVVEGDFNGDLRVSLADLAILQSQIGATSSGTSVLLGVSAHHDHS